MVETSVIVSISGGKDSTASALYLRERGIPYKAIHLDTGWEHPLTEEYVRHVLPTHIGPIEIIEPEYKMADLILHKGMFPSRLGRFCTQQLKVYPFMQWIEDNCAYKPINVVGIRRDESKARSKLEEYEDQEFALVWRPLIDWTVQDV
jgi:3'-phosphoadenosine 5'-phosphosulfate sulfotransferase (PAPS reductase)/FAD synthetase